MNRKKPDEQHRKGSLADMSAFLNSFKEFQQSMGVALDSKLGSSKVTTSVDKGEGDAKGEMWKARHTFAADKDASPPVYIEDPDLPAKYKVGAP